MKRPDTHYEQRAALTVLLHKLMLAYAAEQHPNATTQELLTRELLITISLTDPHQRRIAPLAQQLGIHPTHIRTSLTHLINQGFIVARRTTIDMTEIGEDAAQVHQHLIHTLLGRLQQLSDTTIEELRSLAITIIQDKQRQRSIQPNRLCTTCTAFRPFIYLEHHSPHHCTITNSAFGGPHDLPLLQPHIRPTMDCPVSA